jgi:hypothetical protein
MAGAGGVAAKIRSTKIEECWGLAGLIFPGEKPVRRTENICDKGE